MELLDRAIYGAEWLAKIVQPSGKFYYGFDLTTQEAISGYNILRHAGCLWAMLEVLLYCKSSPLTKDVVSRALDWMIRTSVHVIPGRGLVIAEDGFTKLGGNALAALALMRYHQMFGDRVDYKDIACGLLLNMCLDCISIDGVRCHKRDLETLEATGFKSDFYPGEAALALAIGSKVFEDKSKYFLSKAQMIVVFFYDFRGKNGHVRDHWMLQALLEIVSLPRENSHSDYIYFEYAKGIAEATISDFNEGRVSDRSGPTACRSESLLAYLSMNKEAPREILDSLRSFINIQLRSQILEGIHMGAFREKPDSPMLRNDYTQHNISSFIKMHRFEEGSCQEKKT